MSCLCSITPILMERPLLLLRRVSNTPSLCAAFSYLIDMRRWGEPCIKGHPKITGGIDQVDWLPKELNWSSFWAALTGLSKEHWGALRDIDNQSSTFSATALGHWDLSKYLTISACWRTWLLRPCLSRRELTRRGGRTKACRWHTDWLGWGKLFHPELRQHGKMTRAMTWERWEWRTGNRGCKRGNNGKK
jgi:hypothetical protein